MKNLFKYRFGFLVFVVLIIFSLNFQIVYSQDGKKNAVRLKADYIKIMDSTSYFNIKAFAGTSPL